MGVFDRISPYYDTGIYDRNTESGNTIKYGEIQSYTAENGRIRPVFHRVRPGRSKRNSVSDRINGRSITDRNAVSYGSNTAVNRDWFGAP